MGQVLINPQTQLAEDLDPQVAQQALQAGWHVPLVDQNGQAYAAPFEEAQKLVASGSHAQPTPDQLGYLVKQGKYSTPGQQAKTFIEGALTGLTGPVGSQVESLSGLTTPEDILNRQEFNPGTHTLGEASGMVAGLAAGDVLPEALNMPKLISRAGGAAAEAINATGTFGKAAQLAVQGAVEGSLYEASHQANEALLGDHNLTAESMLSQMGMSAALGGGLNLALAPVLHGIGKASALGKAFFSGAGPEEEQAIIKGLSEKKPNADEIQAAANRLGAPVLDSQLSGSKAVQDWESASINTPRSWPNIKLAQKAKQGYEAATSAINDALGTPMDMSKAQVGSMIAEGITNELEGEYAPIREFFAQNEAAGRQIPIAPELSKSTSDDLFKIEDILGSNGKPLSERSPNYKLVQRVAEELPNISTVKDAMSYKQLLAKDTAGITDGNLRYTVGQVMKKIDGMVNESIIKVSDNPEALRQAISETNQYYGNLKQELEQVGQNLIGKKIRPRQGIDTLVNYLRETPPEIIANKMFTKENSRFLNLLQERFPDQANIVGQFQRDKLRDIGLKFSKDGQILPNAILKEIDKYEPEAKNFLFPQDKLQKIQDADTYLRAMPDKVNPSGTASTQNILGMFNPFKAYETVAYNIADAAKAKAIRQLVSQDATKSSLVTALGHISDFSWRTARNLERNAGGIFGKATADLLNPKRPTMPSQSEPANEPVKMDKIGTMVKNQMQSPEGLANHISDATSVLANYTPKTMNSFGTAVGRGVSFLASKLPQEGQKLAPLDEPMEVSNTEIAKFNRYAQMVENPMSVFKEVKNGTILPQDIETLSNVYPGLYAEMRQRITSKMVNFLAKKDSIIPYQTRLGLSMFLGQNLDSTLAPSALISNQAAIASTNMQQAMQQAQQTKPSKSGMRQMKFLASDKTAAQQAASRTRSS